MKVKVIPVPAPRMTRADRWTDVEKNKGRPAVLRYFKYRDVLSKAWEEQEGEATFPEQVNLKFLMPIPKSWSNKKKKEMLGKPHQQKPDIDNLSKAVMDALAKEDKGVFSLKATKYWAEEGSVEILSEV